MKKNIIVRSVIIIGLLVLNATALFAVTPDGAVKGLETAPTTQVKKTSDGSTSRMTTIPGLDGISKGTLTKADGSVDQVLSYKEPDGTVTTTIRDPSGNTTMATRAADGTYTGDASAINAVKGVEEGKDQIETITSEKVPGAECVCIAKTGNCIGEVYERKYRCTSGIGLSGFQKVFAQIIRFVVNMVLLLGVLAVVGLGVAWSFAGGDDMKAKTNLKSWAINIIVGLIILFMFRYILMFLAPWIYK